MSEDLVEQNLGLARVIAYEYANIPGASLDEAVSEAQQALLRASRQFDSTKGDFVPYAARAVRNALNSLYAKHLRRAQIFPKSLDDRPAWKSGTGVNSAETTLGGRFADSEQDVVREVRRRESLSVLEAVMNSLSPRERIVIEALRSGRSLAEIGDDMGMSKQGVHKISTPALEKLRKKLEYLGYDGMDSKGFLKTSLKGPFKKV